MEKMRICRLCMYEGDNTNLLSIWDNNDAEDLAAKIKNCVSISICRTDKLPCTACVSCIAQVKQWTTFKEKCISSNKILLSDLAEKERAAVIQNINESDEELPDIRNETKDFDSDEELEDFYDYKIDVSENVYKCDLCSEDFGSCFEYLDHQKVHDGQYVFQCSKCTEMFANRNDLVIHEKNHRGPCPQCGKMILKSSLKLHLIKHTDKHKCLQCSKRFNSKAALAQHVITVHTNIKDHICETCGKRFSSQTSMRVHMKSHSDERLYPCKLCNYAGRTASAIYVHMSTHANDLCVCEVCSKTFKSTRNLNDHLRRVHSKEKKHECLYCNKKYVDKYMLQVHLRCHTGVRPYKCTVCDKAFIRSDGLKEHMITHGQRVVYNCDGCGKKFTSRRGISRHNCIVVL